MADHALDRGPARPVASRPGESGQALVETAIVLPVYLLILVGLFFFSEAYNHKVTVFQAARYAGMVYAAGGDSEAEIQQRVEDALAASYYADYGENAGEYFDVSKQPPSFGGWSNPDIGGLPPGDQGDFWADWGIFKGLLDGLVSGLDTTVVTYHYHNPFAGFRSPFPGPGEDPFVESTYAIRGSFTFGGNPWSYEETGYFDWLIDLIGDFLGPLGEAFGKLMDLIGF